MKVTTERLENCQVALTIQVGKERTEQALREAAQRLSREFRIPGFRRGKVPYRVMLERFGREVLLVETLDELIQEVYEEALDETGLEPVAKGNIQDIQLEPLTIKAVVPVAPLVDLGDYRHIRLNPPEVMVGNAEVEEALERLRWENAQWWPVDRPACFGDMAIVDIKGTVDGKVIMDGEKSLRLLANSPYPFPGFNEKLVGLEIGEEREFTLDIPDDFPNPELTGKEVYLKVHLHDLKNRVLPDIDDDLASTIGNFDTLEELKEQLKKDLRARAEREAEEKFTSQVLDIMLERARIEFSPMLLEEEIDEILEEREKRLQREDLSLNEYLSMRGQGEEEYREEIRPLAEDRLRHGLALGEVVKLEGLEISPEERESQGKSPLLPEEMLLAQKALRRLAAIAKGEVEENSVAEEKSSEEAGA